MTQETSNSSPFRGWLFPTALTTLNYPATFLACLLTFAHRFFAALAIAARPAVSKRRAGTQTSLAHYLEAAALIAGLVLLVSLL